MKIKQKNVIIVTLTLIIVLISSIYYIFKDKNQLTDISEKTNQHMVANDEINQVKLIQAKRINKATQEPKQTEKAENINVALIEKELSGLIIGIDAGHQAKGNNTLEKASPNSTKMKAKVSSGTQGVYSGVSEYVVNLEVGLKLKEQLEKLGATVVMVREINDVDISNANRATIMNDNKVDLCIRIHCNGNSDSSVKGAMMLLPKGDETLDIQEESYKAGKIIFESFLKNTNANNAGISYRNDLSGFNWSEIPVCLIELGFMSNKEEDLLLTNEEYQNKCVKGLVQGILNWNNAT